MLWRIRGFVFMIRSRGGGRGKDLVPLSPWIVSFFSFFILILFVDRYFSVMHNLREELNWINIILPNSSRRKRELKANACHWLENRYFFIFSPDRKFPQMRANDLSRQGEFPDISSAGGRQLRELALCIPVRKLSRNVKRVVSDSIIGTGGGGVWRDRSDN